MVVYINYMEPKQKQFSEKKEVKNNRKQICVRASMYIKYESSNGAVINLYSYIMCAKAIIYWAGQFVNVKQLK